MKQNEILNLLQLLEKGDLNTLKEALEPFLEKGDLDARFITTFFSDRSETGEEFDARIVADLTSLTELRYPNAMYSLAWRYYHGDDVGIDQSKYRSLLEAAALLGHPGARRDLAIQVEIDLGWKGFADPFEELDRLPHGWPEMFPMW